MRARWLSDLTRLEKAYGPASAEKIANVSSSESEVVRNLATAIAHLGEMITTDPSGTAPSLDKERGE
jgi:hypothetical protein